jgi:hypothetical protein
MRCGKYLFFTITAGGSAGGDGDHERIAISRGSPEGYRYDVSRARVGGEIIGTNPGR